MSLSIISRSKTRSPPIVLIHDISGSMFPYVSLGVKLPDLASYNIYGISATLPLDPSEKHESMHAWALAYASVIVRELKSELGRNGGKLVLGGWSLGGILATEIARILATPFIVDGLEPVSLTVLGLVLLDSHAPWTSTLSASAAEGTSSIARRVLAESRYFTFGQKEHILKLIAETGPNDWPGLSDITCKAWLITPNKDGANGLEEWFGDGKGTVIRIGQEKEGCDHFSMMQEQWVGELAIQVSLVFKSIMREVR